MKGYFHKPVIANIGGFSIDEFRYCCERVDKEPQVGLIEVNVSCPNVHEGGVNFGSTPEGAAAVTRAVKQVASKPVYLKLSPNVTDIVAVAKACEEAGADGISLINTLLGMRIDLARRRPVLANTMGGLSGPAIFPVAVRMVWEVAQAVDLPILGMGGVSKGEDAAQMMLAGASAVAVGTALFADPYAPIRVRDELAALAAGQGLERAAELIGGVKPW